MKTRIVAPMFDSVLAELPGGGDSSLRPFVIVLLGPLVYGGVLVASALPMAPLNAAAIAGASPAWRLGLGALGLVVAVWCFYRVASRPALRRSAAGEIALEDAVLACGLVLWAVLVPLFWLG